MNNTHSAAVWHLIEEAFRAGHTDGVLWADPLRCGNGQQEAEDTDWATFKTAVERKMNPLPCGYWEAESNYREPGTGAHRTAKCEGGRLVIRGNGIDSTTDGNIFITSRPCPQCAKLKGQ